MMSRPQLCWVYKFCTGVDWLADIDGRRRFPAADQVTVLVYMSRRLPQGNLAS